MPELSVLAHAIGVAAYVHDVAMVQDAVMRAAAMTRTHGGVTGKAREGPPMSIYGTLAELIASLEEARIAGSLRHRLSVLTAPSLMVVDEIGYLPVSQNGAVLFYQLMSPRYEHASTVLTSNKGFEEWGDVFGDEVMAVALIDRVLHHCHIVNIRGNSYLMRQHTGLWQQLRANTDQSSTARSLKKTKEVQAS